MARARIVDDLLGSATSLPQLWGRRAFRQIRLRWFVPPAMIVSLLVGRRLGFELPVVPIVGLAVANAAYNTLFAWWLRRYHDRLYNEAWIDRYFTIGQVVADYAAMLLLLHFTGGVWSPLAIFLLFHVILAAVQFRRRVAYVFAALAAAGLWLLLLAYTQGWLDPVNLVYHGRQLNPSDRGVEAVIMLAFFSATVFITADLVTRIMRRLRVRVRDLAHATRALGEANDALIELNRERTRLMLEVAHNLRSPLSAGLGLIELLRDGDLGPVTDKQATHLKRLDVRLRDQHRMIGELLTIGMVRDASHEIPDVVVDLRELARHIDHAFRAEAERKRLTFELACDDDLPEIESGADLLEKMMDNLVSNAIKYTPEGGTVGVQFHRNGNGFVRITVTDTGIGIPKAEQRNLFKEFFRASNAKQHTENGTGLGLALVQQSVHRHHGRMNLTSAEGRGTEIEIVLPTHQPGSPRPGS
ncbi:MAG: hypothetical protein GY716_03070 [bacterium]|nr:hypothetical protein [bacterium]